MEDVHARFMRALEQPGTSTATSSAPDRRGARRPAQRGPRPHRARARGAARVRQDRARGGAARHRVARRPRLRAGARALLPARRARAVRVDRIARPPAAPRDHRDRARERRGQPGRHHVRVPHRRGDGRDGRRHRARARSRPRRLPARTRCGATSRRSTGSSTSTRRPTMYLESRKLVERASRWLLRHRRRPLPVARRV